MSVDIFGCHTREDATGIQSVEARVAAKLATMHRTASSITKNYSAENSNNVLRNPDIRTHVCVFVYVFKKKKKGTTKKSTG